MVHSIKSDSEGASNFFTRHYNNGGDFTTYNYLQRGSNRPQMLCLSAQAQNEIPREWVETERALTPHDPALFPTSVILFESPPK